MSGSHPPSPAGGHGAAAGRHRAAARTAGPASAITMLRAALSDRGITSTRIKEIDEDTAMLIAGERIIVCRDGCFWWATGRFREGRTITGVHDAADPAGAARRLTRASPRNGGGAPAMRTQ